ncbi:hypothetical protein ACWGUN_09625 [Streptomyces koyangensis]
MRLVGEQALGGAVEESLCGVGAGEHRPLVGVDGVGDRGVAGEGEGEFGRVEEGEADADAERQRVARARAVNPLAGPGARVPVRTTVDQTS